MPGARAWQVYQIKATISLHTAWHVLVERQGGGQVSSVYHTYHTVDGRIRLHALHALHALRALCTLCTLWTGTHEKVTLTSYVNSN